MLSFFFDWIGAFFGIPGLVIAAGVLEGKLVPELKEKMESIKQFYDGLKTKIGTASTQIDIIKTTLKTEIMKIGDIKIQTENTKAYVNVDDIPKMKDDVIKAVQKLMESCTEYRARHNSKINLVQNIPEWR